MSGTITFSILPDALLPLVDKFYRSHRSPMRAAKGATIWVAKQQEIVGAMSLTAVAEGQWLTGLFVAPHWRGQAVAGRLLEEALRVRTGPVWLLPPGACRVLSAGGVCLVRGSAWGAGGSVAAVWTDQSVDCHGHPLIRGTGFSREGIVSGTKYVSDLPPSSRLKPVPPGLQIFNHPHSDQDPGTSLR